MSCWDEYDENVLELHDAKYITSPYVNSKVTLHYVHFNSIEIRPWE